MITASLVLYHNDPTIFCEAINSFLASAPDGHLWVSDNSLYPLCNSIFSHERIHYIHNDLNIGFGAGHNRVFSILPDASKFHLILNPDIRFEKSVLPQLQSMMCSDENIGALMPKIVYPDGRLQRLAKLLPSPIDLIFRRFVPVARIKDKINRLYELHDLPHDDPIEVPSISGCCLLVRTSALRKVGGFDERFFMYMEDVDLVRRLGDFSKIIYLPTVVVVHDYAKGSYFNRKLFLFHITSAIKYFFKWGWLVDHQRKQRNITILNKLNDK